ncbi:MAG: hypothetical protein HKN73_14025, partial [Gemmatimonadetes bacterium]|nr:hypothetical protein [Gemmatimonadota bacterium]
MAERTADRHPPEPRRARLLSTHSQNRTQALRVALVLSFAHAVNDSFTSFLAPLLPRIMDKLGISIALAAVLSMTLS